MCGRERGKYVHVRVSVTFLSEKKERHECHSHKFCIFQVTVISEMSDIRPNTTSEEGEFHMYT